MLYWSSKMYLDAGLLKKKKRYQRLLEKNKLTRPLYCITLPVNGENIMEIYSSAEIWFRWYRKRRMTVVGLALSRENAEKLVAQICLDTVSREGTISPGLIYDYFDEPVG